MNTATKLGAYILGMTVVFAGAAGVGNIVGGSQSTPIRPVTRID